MSDDFSVNFGNAKEPEPLVLPDEGNYNLVIETYELKQAKNVESRAKGFNIALKFKFEEGQIEDDRVRVYHNLWVHRENPWAAKLFFEAVSGKDLSDDDGAFAEAIQDPDLWIGERVGCSLVHEQYEGKRGTAIKLSPADNAWYPAK